MHPWSRQQSTYLLRKKRASAARCRTAASFLAFATSYGLKELQTPFKYIFEIFQGLA